MMMMRVKGMGFMGENWCGDILYHPTPRLINEQNLERISFVWKFEVYKRGEGRRGEMNWTYIYINS
jgi:hypothetical protein